MVNEVRIDKGTTPVEKEQVSDDTKVDEGIIPYSEKVNKPRPEVKKTKPEFETREEAVEKLNAKAFTLFNSLPPVYNKNKKAIADADDSC